MNEDDEYEDEDDLMKKLREIDLSSFNVADLFSKCIYYSLDHFTHLERLDLCGNFICKIDTLYVISTLQGLSQSHITSTLKTINLNYSDTNSLAGTEDFWKKLLSLEELSIREHKIENITEILQIISASPSIFTTLRSLILTGIYPYTEPVINSLVGTEFFWSRLCFLETLDLSRNNIGRNTIIENLL